MLKRIVSGSGSGAARVLGVVTYALAALWLTGAVLAVLYAYRSGLPTLGFTGVMVAAIAIGALGMSTFTQWGDLYGQRIRDLRAETIYGTAREGHPTKAYTLYLRPFASTDAIAETGMGMTIAPSALGFGLGALVGERFELEAQIEKAVRPLGPMIGLGAPLEHFGAGRVTVSEAEWRDAVKTLMKGASLIVMLPSSRPGTLEEIGYVLDSDIVKKTVFVDPPRAGAKKYRQADEWKKLQDAFKQRGFALPQEKSRAALMFFGKEKAPQLVERLDIDAEDNIERLFRRVITRIRKAEAAA